MFHEPRPCAGFFAPDGGSDGAGLGMLSAICQGCIYVSRGALTEQVLMCILWFSWTVSISNIAMGTGHRETLICPSVALSVSIRERLYWADESQQARNASSAKVSDAQNY